MTDMEVSDVKETYFSFEDGRPTLWDTQAPGRTRAVCLTAYDGRIEIHTDPEIVEAFLDDA
jgi:hypothetical protein